MTENAVPHLRSVVTDPPDIQPTSDRGQGPRISRRHLFGVGAGGAAAGLLGACGDPSTGARFSHRQTCFGTRVTSGRSISARFGQTVRTGSLLVAVVSRMSNGTLAPTIGQVSDDTGNHWKQAVEFFSGDHYGVDIWYCESATGGNRPLVTGIGLGYPVLPGITGMNMTLFEYTGSSGYQLCDQICQVEIKDPDVVATTNFPLRSNNELAVSVVMG